MNSTAQNPYGCCDGYIWDSAVDNCAGRLSAIEYFFHNKSTKKVNYSIV